ncbi:Trypsin-like serine proteases [Alteracholeplasma palmae J233]|uniref:Trypsin-like serine proteases n=1 Tax=Alteracholeplasma palmae (strain ATCC 49389 / J233) TaxID=1318466 RepID=U4KR24_ALTPJ|nr:trypsin-like peptidase domain-containing protein [Alteracholeplasma palmae]CCV63801.1 Trypsin-like serine proteases [Alteracholeplasma palmae J233]
MKTIKKISIFILSLVLVLTLVGCQQATQTISTAYGLDNYQTISDRNLSDEDLTILSTNRIMSSTVEITSNFTFSYSQSFGGFFEGSRTITNSASSKGTAFFINSDGYLLTNAHVISLEKYESLPDFKYVERKISINFAESSLTFNVSIIDYDQKLDLALLKIEDNALENIQYLKFYNLTDPAHSSYKTESAIKLLYGQSVLVVGNANGYGISVTKGIVSAPLRYFSDSNNQKTEAIQIDAAVNSGNSGGPLSNMYGVVIGVVTFKVVTETSESLGYAIPANVVINYLNSLENKVTFHTTNTYNDSYTN